MNWEDLVCKSKGKAIPVTDREHPHRVVRRRGFPIFCLDSQLTDGGKVVSLTHRPPFTSFPQEDSWYSLLLESESIPES
jgi:hypothetical protein